MSFFHQCSKMQIKIKKFNIQTCFFQFLWFFRLKCWFQGQIIPTIHLILTNAYTQMCFDTNINGKRDVKFLIGIIGHCTHERNLLYNKYVWGPYTKTILYLGSQNWRVLKSYQSPFLMMSTSLEIPNYYILFWWKNVFYPGVNLLLL